MATFLFVPAEAGQGPYELRATLIVYPLIIFGAQAVNPVCILHYPLLVFAEVASRMWGVPWAVRIPASVMGIVLITWRAGLLDARFRAWVNRRLMAAMQTSRAGA